MHPLWETWADLVHPDAQEIIDALEDNRDWWLKQIPDSPSSSVHDGAKNKAKQTKPFWLLLIKALFSSPQIKEESVEADDDEDEDCRRPQSDPPASASDGSKSESGLSTERIQFQMTLHEEDEEGEEKDEVKIKIGFSAARWPSKASLSEEKALHSRHGPWRV